MSVPRDTHQLSRAELSSCRVFIATCTVTVFARSSDRHLMSLGTLGGRSRSNANTPPTTMGASDLRAPMTARAGQEAGFRVTASWLSQRELRYEHHSLCKWIRLWEEGLRTGISVNGNNRPCHHDARSPGDSSLAVWSLVPARKLEATWPRLSGASAFTQEGCHGDRRFRRVVGRLRSNGHCRLSQGLPGGRL